MSENIKNILVCGLGGVGGYFGGKIAYKIAQLYEEKFSTENLISLLGNDFKIHTKNYVKWGWDFYRNVKMDILRDFFLKSKFEIVPYRTLQFVFELKKVYKASLLEKSCP